MSPQLLTDDILANPKYRNQLADMIEEEANAELRACRLPPYQEDPLKLIEDEKLQIKTKEGQRIPLRLNSCQRRLLDKIQELRAQKKPVRIWILKFRQGGMSTLCEAVLYCLTSLLPNRHALVMADEKDKSSYLHEICKFFHAHMKMTDPEITPSVKRSNEKKLEFEALHSQIMIQTADNVDAPRARTYQYVLLSECAYYRDLPGILQALQGVPDHPDTIVIGETTANGAGTPFHKEWLAAQAGNSEWVPLFFAWYEMEDHRRPLPWYPIHEIEYDRENGSLAAFEREEQYLKATYHLRDEQLNWRRWKIVNGCDRRTSVFRVEYPSDDEEAFQVSGALYYDPSITRTQKAQKPIAMGYLVPSDNSAEFRESTAGPIRIYAWPRQNDYYLIAGDPSEGIDGDEAAVVVRHSRSNSNVAEIYGNIDPDTLAMQCHLLNLLYPGLIVPERNGVGAAFVGSLLRLTGSVFCETINETGANSSKRYGWATTEVSRPLMFEQLRTELRENSVSLVGEQSIKEVRQLVNTGKGRPEAPPGGQDGLAICNAIASYVRKIRPGQGTIPFATRYATEQGWTQPEENMGLGFAD